METRKIQKVGYSTLSISLPRNWIKKRGLKRGDTIFLMPKKDGSLRIFSRNLLKPRKKEEKWVCNIDMCNDPKMLERIIVGNYILGRDYIYLKSSNRIKSEQIKEIRDITRKLIGLGIIEETSNHILLQCSVDPRKFQLDMLLRRLSTISLTIVKESIQALVQFDESLAKDAIDREDEADMMFFVSMRLLFSAQRNEDIAQAIGLTDPLQVLYFGLMLRYLELIADYAEETSRIIIELIHNRSEILPKWAIDRINNFNELAHDLVVKSIDCFFSGDIKVASNLSETLIAVEHQRDKLSQELPQISRLCCILWNISRVAYNGTGIALKAINNALEKETKICWRQ
jgi:phosphate uptake regulator